MNRMHVGWGICVMAGALLAVGCESGGRNEPGEVRSNPAAKKDCVRLVYDDGGQAQSVLQGAEKTKIVVMLPHITSRSPEVNATFIAEKFRSLIIQKLMIAARTNRSSIQFVQAPSDWNQYQEMNDLIRAGVTEGSTKKMVLGDAIMQGSVDITVQYACRLDDVHKPDLLKIILSLSTGNVAGAVDGGLQKNPVSIQQRWVTVDVAMQLNGRDGTQPITFTLDAIEPVFCEQNKGVMGDQSKLPVTQADIETAMNRAADQYVSVFFPIKREINVPVEVSLTTSALSRKGIAMLKAAQNPADTAAAVAKLQEAVDAAPTCHRTRFALSIALEKQGNLIDALAQCREAIAYDKKNYDLTQADQYKKMLADPYFQAEKRQSRLAMIRQQIEIDRELNAPKPNEAALARNTGDVTNEPSRTD